MPGTVLTVASGKGGVGKTTTAVNLAVALWREGNAVALVDADLGMANLAAVLDLTPSVTLHDVLAGRAPLEEAVVEARGGDLVVVPGERDLSGFASADPEKLGTALAELAEGRDYVVVDTGAGVSYEDVLPLGVADEVLLVTTPEPAAVGDTRKTLELSGLLDGAVLGVVVTRARPDTDAGAVAAEVGVELLGVIPEDPAVTESTSGAGPLESSAPDAPATAAYRELAAAVEAASPREPGAPAPEEASTVVDAAGTTEGASGDDVPGGGEASTTSPSDAAADVANDDPDGEEEDTAPSTPAREEAADGAEPEPVSEEGADGAEGADGEGEPADDAGGDVDDGSVDGEAPTDGDEGTGAEDEDEGGRDVDEGEPADGDEPSTGRDDADEAADDGDDDGDDETGESGDAERRGGFFGWLGRRFS